MSEVSDTTLADMCRSEFWANGTLSAADDAVLVARELQQLRTTIKKLHEEGLVFDNWDDKKLDDLLDNDPEVAAARQAALKSDLTEKSAVIANEIKVRDDIAKDKLAVIRDLLLEGQDIEAVAILAHELGMEPAPYDRRLHFNDFVLGDKPFHWGPSHLLFTFRSRPGDIRTVNVYSEIRNGRLRYVFEVME